MTGEDGKAKPFEHVAVLAGGPSKERDVSLRSGAAVAAGLRESGYAVDLIDVTERRLDLPQHTEAVFIALHGEFGEDGQVQSLLDARGMPYTGSGAAASRIAIDKALTKQRIVAAGVPTPRYALLTDDTPPELPWPVVVKPLCQGSTLGVHLVRDAATWTAAVADARRYGARVLVEAFVPGRELTVALVDGDTLPVIEICAPHDWYDYEAKYTGGRTHYRVPAPLEADVARRCREAARATWHAMGCRGFARVDVRLDPAGELFVLEINTIPGFTETSLLPKAAAEIGCTFAALCDRIMRLARCDNPDGSDRGRAPCPGCRKTD